MRIIMTALAPLECRHPRLGQSLWRLGVMRPQCLHAHATLASVLVCPCSFARQAALGRCLSPPSLRPRAPVVGLALGAGRPWCVPPPPLTGVCVTRLLGAGGCPPSPRPGVLWLALRAGGAVGWGLAPHRRHPRVPLVPSGTAVPYSPVRQRARSARWVCVAEPETHDGELWRLAMAFLTQYPPSTLPGTPSSTQRAPAQSSGHAPNACTTGTRFEPP